MTPMSARPSTESFPQLSDVEILAIRSQVLAAQTRLALDRVFDSARTNERTRHLSRDEIAQHLPLCEKVIWSAARNASDAEWIELVREGKRPGILALSPAELEQVSGGNPIIIGLIAVIAVGLYNFISGFFGSDESGNRQSGAHQMDSLAACDSTWAGTFGDELPSY